MEPLIQKPTNAQIAKFDPKTAEIIRAVPELIAKMGSFLLSLLR